MKFIDEKHIELYLKNLTFIGQESEGVCYLNKTNNQVIKIFHEFFYGEKVNLSKEKLMKFNNIKQKTFIWPSDIITINSEIVGYTMPYVPFKSLCEIDPLRINLNTFAKGIIHAEKDINLVTENNVRIFDIMYNILYKAGKFKVIDTTEYSENPTRYEVNRRGFDLEIMKFLVDNYFNYFVESDKLLQEMYLSHDVSGYEFLIAFKNKLSEYMGFEITKLNEAKTLVRRYSKSKYERNLY